jgi:tetratricopeptide (TPR) repeat protein
MNSGDLAGARSVLEETVRADPENPELQLALVEVLEASGETEAALAMLEGLVQEHSHRSAYRFVLAQIYQRVGRHEEAARQARILTEVLASARAGSSQEAGLRAAFMLLIDASTLSGDVDRALGSAVLAERRFPEDPRFPLKRAEIFLVEGRDEDAAAIFQALAGRPESPSDGVLSMVYLRAGARLEREGDPERAEKLLREAVARNPENHSAMNYLGYMMADRDVSLEEARELIERALSLDADNGAYLDSLGWVLFRLGRYVDAEAPLRRAASIIPEEPVVHDHLGDLYWAQGRREEAVDAWREAIRLGIENPARLREKINRSVSADAPGR